LSAYPKAILFDLDDTLIVYDGVSAPAWDACCEEFMNSHAFSFTKEDLLLRLEEVREWFWSDPGRHKRGREHLLETRREIVGMALGDLGVTDTVLVRELADRYSAYRDELISVFPSTYSVLDALRSSGVRLGLITNGSSAGQREKLARFHLADYFEIILIDQELGFGKPDPRVYLHALDLLGLSPGEVWMVGDNLIWDIQAPQSVGIHSIWHDVQGSGLPAESTVCPDGIVTDISLILRQFPSSPLKERGCAVPPE